MSNTEFARAQFSEANAQGKPIGTPVPVHFNPVSLQYSLTNTMKPDPKNKRKQMIGQSAAKLTMDLQFDTTHSGEDVRHSTAKIARLMVPAKKGSTADMVPPTVLFSWGSYRFLGIIESYKETIDFFSMQGVPLRASVNLTLADQDAIFDSSADAAGGTAPPVQVPSQGGQSTSAMAAQGGDPNAGRQIAADNGLESMRFPSGPLNVSDSTPLRPPAAFASADASASAGIGAGIGGDLSAGAGLSAGIGGGISGGIGASAGLGFSAGASASFGANASAGFGASAFSAGASAGAGFGAGAGFSAGASASFSAGAGFSASSGFSSQSGFSTSVVSGSWSAGVPATSGAFAGLTVTTRTGAAYASASFDTSRLLPTDDSIAFTADASASFDITGQAQMETDSGLRADLSANAGVSGFLTFDSD